MKIEENVSLRDLTTMNTGGKAKYFCRVCTIPELKEALDFVHKHSLPYFIIGGGSNLVFSDKGFSGLVIKMEIKSVVFKDKGEHVFVTAGAGVVWDDLVEETVERGLYGLENLSLIPGTVGAASVQNIGAYGTEVEEVIEQVEVLDIVTQKIKIFSHNECLFEYRKSFFKKEGKGKYIVVRVVFKLLKKSDVRLSYGSLKKVFDEKGISSPTPREIREAIIVVRKEKLPYDGDIGSAGSYFKNPIVSQDHYTKLLSMYPEMPGFSVSKSEVKIPAGWLIDNVCGLRGSRDGNVGTYEHQALVLVNYGNATTEEIKKFAEKIVACVKEKTNISLEREVEYVE